MVFPDTLGFVGIGVFLIWRGFGHPCGTFGVVEEVLRLFAEDATRAPQKQGGDAQGDGRRDGDDTVDSCRDVGLQVGKIW